MSTRSVYAVLTEAALHSGQRRGLSHVTRKCYTTASETFPTPQVHRCFSDWNPTVDLLYDLETNLLKCRDFQQRFQMQSVSNIYFGDVTMNFKWSSFSLSLLETLKESLVFIFQFCQLLVFLIKMKDMK